MCWAQHLNHSNKETSSRKQTRGRAGCDRCLHCRIFNGKKVIVYYSHVQKAKSLFNRALSTCCQCADSSLRSSFACVGTSVTSLHHVTNPCYRHQKQHQTSSGIGISSIKLIHCCLHTALSLPARRSSPGLRPPRAQAAACTSAATSGRSQIHAGSAVDGKTRDN